MQHLFMPRSLSLQNWFFIQAFSTMCWETKDDFC